MQIKEMTTEQLQQFIRNTVDEILDEYLCDPDDGLEIKESFKQSLLDIRNKRLKAKLTISSEEVYKKYGIEN
ncbi:hypothetical protein [Geminocystis sp. NIES-3709]|uniref:hypothetical protein n=1 Tax=Geminocystis sp. NIES-3709 TaxID=1617448 RepID=UPI0005FC6ED1|nr:hypothetical protein [Geminocystis sp. NIES-3709]BAQ66628.1 hypothetical protein GM3709_3393 [Geminocystis sp. NIES-3709]